MQQLLDQLNSRNPAIRDAALRVARSLPPDELLQLVLLESRNRRTQNRNGLIAYLIVSLVCFSISVICNIPHDSWTGIYLFITLAAANMGQTVYTGSFIRARNQISVLLSEVEDVRFVEPMLRLEFAPEQVEIKELHAPVKRLLPQIRADHALQWSKEDKTALLLPLKRPNKDKELTIGCLKALEQVGDASAMPAVRRLVEEVYPAGSQEAIALAAQECLLYLESNTSRFQQAETLLRASETTTRPDILLRPAQPAPDTTPTEQLLRPGE